jgi:hypothetical protein
MSTAQSVTATFNPATGVVANSQSFGFTIRQPPPTFAPLYLNQYIITLTGSSPNPGPLTFRITRFPAHQDVSHSMGLIDLGRWYQIVDPVTGERVTGLASDYFPGPSAVNITTGDVTGVPAVVYTPNVCHDIFYIDGFEFVAIDALGNVSAPATVTMTAPQQLCNHA